MTERQPVLIQSRDNPLLVRLRKLARDPSAYRRLEEIWLEGEHLCSALIEHGGRARQAVVSQSAWSREAGRRLAHHAERVAVVPDALFEGFSALPSAGQIGFVIATPPPSVLDGAVATIVLDRLQDAGNVGSILRTAAAFGVRQVLALQGTAALWSPKVLRAGMGAHFGLRLIEGLREDDLAALTVSWVGTSLETERWLHETVLPHPCAWLLGHEGQGVAPSLLARCRTQVRIPQPGGEESLNVAAAAAVCLYEGMRQQAAR